MNTQERVESEFRADLTPKLTPFLLPPAPLFPLLRNPWGLPGRTPAPWKTSESHPLPSRGEKTLLHHPSPPPAQILQLWRESLVLSDHKKEHSLPEVFLKIGRTQAAERGIPDGRVRGRRAVWLFSLPTLPRWFPSTSIISKSWPMCVTERERETEKGQQRERRGVKSK